MKNFVIILLLCYITGLHAQVHESTRLALMQGVWDCSTNDEASIFKIIKDKNCLEFTYKPSDDLDFTLFDMIIGFQSLVTEYNEIQVINIDSLKENGLYYTEIIDKKDIGQDGKINKTFCIIPSYYECDGKILSINGGKLFEYEKIPKLPNNAIKNLYYRGIHDIRDYIKDYLGIKVVEIASPQSTVYSEPNKPTATQLTKGDVVIVLEEKGNWVKVDYGGSNPGWVKKEDTQKRADKNNL